MNYGTEAQRVRAQVAFDNQEPGLSRYEQSVEDFIKDNSDSAALWNEVFGNLEKGAQVAFMARLKIYPAHAEAWMHDEAREYLYAFIGSQGLAKAREVWG